MNNANDHIRAVVTVAEMARMVGLSRARFYQLMGTAFPLPERDEKTGRPFFTEQQQKTCLEVRRRNCGIDGRPILFYARRAGTMKTPIVRRKTTTNKNKKSDNKFATVVEAVKALGLTGATHDQVASAMTLLFPGGVNGMDEGEVIRSVFVHLQRQNSSDSLGR